MFAGSMSRWITSRLCAYWTAAQTGRDRRSRSALEHRAEAAGDDLDRDLLLVVAVGADRREDRPRDRCSSSARRT
jgi:hypothetical protein